MTFKGEREDRPPSLGPRFSQNGAAGFSFRTQCLRRVKPMTNGRTVQRTLTMDLLVAHCHSADGLFRLSMALPHLSKEA